MLLQSGTTGLAANIELQNQNMLTMKARGTPISQLGKSTTLRNYVKTKMIYNVK